MTVGKKSQNSRDSYHHGDLRRELLRVAREEICRNGAQTVSLSSLARLAGVSQPAPYRHFADRNALLESVAIEGFEELTHVLSHAVAACAPAEGLRTTALEYVAYGEANTEIYRLMFASRLVPEAAPGSALSVAADNAFNCLTRVLSASSPKARAEEDAFVLWAQLHGFVMLKADGFIRRPLGEYVEKSGFLKPHAPSHLAGKRR